MDNIPDGTENDRVNKPRAAEPQTSKKWGRKLWWAWIAGGAALLAALALVLAPTVFPSGAGEKNIGLIIESPSPALSPSAAGEEGADTEEIGGVYEFRPEERRPLLYKEGGDIFLVTGAGSVKLEGAAGSIGFRGEVSDNGNTLYYIANLKDSFSAGDLMRIRLGEKNSKPECIAKNVYSARVSPDGEKILFITGRYESSEETALISVNGDTASIKVDPEIISNGLLPWAGGNLYMCSPGGEPALIAESILGYDYGFSADGSYVYYYIYGADGYGKLYLYSGGETKKIFENKEKKGNEVYIDNSGRVLILSFDRSYFFNGYTIYLCEGGGIRRIADKALYVQSLGRADEFIYITPDKELIFYNRGSEQVVSGKDSGLRFYNYYLAFETVSKRFIFAEGGKGSSSPVLYEFTAQGGKVKIGNISLSKNTAPRYYPDADYSHIAYHKEDGLYMAGKSGGVWNETKLCDYGGDAVFDESGDYIYFCSSPDSTWVNNTLCRMSLTTGETEVLFTNVNIFRYILWKDGCYAESTGGDLYFIKNSNYRVLIMRDLSENDIGLQATEDGVYIFSYEPNKYPVFTDIYYISGGKRERIYGGGEDVEFINCYGLEPLIND